MHVFSTVAAVKNMHLNDFLDSLYRAAFFENSHEFSNSSCPTGQDKKSQLFLTAL